MSKGGWYTDEAYKEILPILPKRLAYINNSVQGLMVNIGKKNNNIDKLFLYASPPLTPFLSLKTAYIYPF